MNRTPDTIYEDALEILAKANKELYEITPNQQAMPQHLRGVAADFANAKELIGQLEEYALNAARGWENDVMMNESQGGRRNRRKTRKARKGRKN